MAWLARSIANSILAPDPDEPSTSPPRGVREDLSELTDAVAHRLHGLASFLAPPPDPAGDLTGRLRAGLSRLPGRQAVAELAKIASSLLPPEDGDAVAAAAGVTEEVVAFVKDASMRPELWLDFPLLPGDEDSDEFDITDAQQDHALGVESVVPELAYLRIELCPGHMSEGCFWMIYFVLLHPKLKKEDAELLSTPQILEAREKLSHNLQYQTKLQGNEDTVAVSFSNVNGTVPPHLEMANESKDLDNSARDTSYDNVDYGIPQPIDLEVVSKDSVFNAAAVSLDNISGNIPVQLVPVLKDTHDVSQSRMEESTSDFSTADVVTMEHPVQMSEITLVDDKSTTEEDPPKQSSTELGEESRIFIQKTDDDDGDEWLEEETGDTGSTSVPIGDDEDVSFSDLEEEDGTK